MTRILAVLVLLASWPAPALAHSRLIEPPGRSTDDSLVEAPCGGTPAGEPVTLDAGTTIDLRWVATQSHANLYRVAFSADGATGFDDNVIGTVPDVGAQEYVQAVPLPACTCDACALQLAQFTVTGNVAYYSCADIRLVGEALPQCNAVIDDGTTSTNTAGAGDDSGDTTATNAGGSTAGDESETSDGPAATGDATTGGTEPASSIASAGCGCATEHPRTPGLWGIAMVAVRRRPREGHSRRRPPAGIEVPVPQLTPRPDERRAKSAA